MLWAAEVELLCFEGWKVAFPRLVPCLELWGACKLVSRVAQAGKFLQGIKNRRKMLASSVWCFSSIHTFPTPHASLFFHCLSFPTAPQAQLYTACLSFPGALWSARNIAEHSQTNKAPTFAGVPCKIIGTISLRWTKNQQQTLSEDTFLLTKYLVIVSTLNVGNSHCPATIVFHLSSGQAGWCST